MTIVTRESADTEPGPGTHPTPRPICPICGSNLGAMINYATGSEVMMMHPICAARHFQEALAVIVEPTDAEWLKAVESRRIKVPYWLLAKEASAIAHQLARDRAAQAQEETK